MKNFELPRLLKVICFPGVIILGVFATLFWVLGEMKR